VDREMAGSGEMERLGEDITQTLGDDLRPGIQ
jgi:hypothetical protein